MTHPNLNQYFFRDDAASTLPAGVPAGVAALPGLAESPMEPTAEGSFEKQWLHTLAHVLTEEIQELLSAEKQAGVMLPKMARAATDSILRSICEKEAAHSVMHGQRLEQVHQMLGQQPDGRTCLQIESLLQGVEETMAENNAGLARDLALLSSVRKIKQFEVAGYCSARDFAQLLGLAPVAELLQKTVDELTTTDARLGLLGEILAAQTGLPEFL